MIASGIHALVEKFFPRALSVASDEVRLTPTLRFRLAFYDELRFDEQGRLRSVEQYKKFIAALQVSEQKRDSAVKSWLVITSAMSAVLFGADLTIPGLNTSLKNLPAALEITTALSIICFVFLLMAFHTHQCYGAIVSIYSQAIANGSSVDPDYIMASEVHNEFFLKMFRIPMHIGGLDTYLPGAGFEFASKAIAVLFGFLIECILILYLSLVFYSVISTVFSASNYIILTLYVVFVCTAVALSLAILLSELVQFRFRNRFYVPTSASVVAESTPTDPSISI